MLCYLADGTLNLDFFQSLAFFSLVEALSATSSCSTLLADHEYSLDDWVHHLNHSNCCMRLSTVFLGHGLHRFRKNVEKAALVGVSEGKTKYGGIPAVGSLPLVQKVYSVRFQRCNLCIPPEVNPTVHRAAIAAAVQKCSFRTPVSFHGAVSCYAQCFAAGVVCDVLLSSSSISSSPAEDGTQSNGEGTTASTTDGAVTPKCSHEYHASPRASVVNTGLYDSDVYGTSGVAGAIVKYTLPQSSAECRELLLAGGHHQLNHNIISLGHLRLLTKTL